jgi:hypothetical protein
LFLLLVLRGADTGIAPLQIYVQTMCQPQSGSRASRKMVRGAPIHVKNSELKNSGRVVKRQKLNAFWQIYASQI